MRRILLVSNGVLKSGLANRFCGWTDPPLPASSRQSLLAYREQFYKQGETLPKVWYVSDRRRAVEGFEIMSAGLHAPVVRLTDKLREMNFGDYENLTWDELPLDFQRHYEVCQRQPMELKFPGGESFRELCDRVSSAALEILSYEDDGSNLGIVGHQGSVRILAMMANGTSANDFFAETQVSADCRWLTLGLPQVAAWRRANLSPLGCT